MRNKKVAAIIAFFFGIWGVHRFYLGQRFRGILHIGLFIFTMGLTIEEGFPFIMAPALLGFIDFILLLAMPKEEFDIKYNKDLQFAPTQQRAFYREEAPDFRRSRNNFHSGHVAPSHPIVNPFKKSGIEKYKEYDYDGAILDFQKALRVKYEDFAVHFNLSCCYSINESVHQCLFHLDKAMRFGFVELDRIHNHPALAYVRTNELFERFVENGYSLIDPKQQAAQPEAVKATTEEKEEEELEDFSAMIDNEVPKQKSLLEQIVRLGELREKGILTDEEFQQQKQNLLETS